MIKKLFLLLIIGGGLLGAEEYCFSREWLNLLYYEKTFSGYQSAAAYPEFFISEQGRNDPQAEYAAALRLAQAGDLWFKTKFPLRYKYIARRNNLAYAPAVQVSANVKKVVLAYPNRYMQNPVSMFGHLFLALETDRGLLDSKILHYVADTQQDAQGLTYAFKGLTGKYKGMFYQEIYYKKIKEYNYLEDRAVFYYDLKLSAEQIEDLQLHQIELKDTFFFYYFLDANCAFYIGKLLNVILPEDIIEKKIYTLPADIINNLQSADLLAEERARPATTKEFNYFYNTLTFEQKKQVQHLLVKEAAAFEADPEAWRTFLLISEFIINNHSSYAEIIRRNRIHAYQKLHGSRIRPELQIARPRKINYNSTRLDLSGNSAGIMFAPIHFAEPEQFTELKDVRFLEFGAAGYLQETPRYKFNLLEIENITQANFILPTISWSAKSQFAYQDGFFANQELYLGYAFNVLNKGIGYILWGGNFTNYDSLSERDLGRLDCLAGARLGLKQNLLSGLDLLCFYEHKYKTDYAGLTLTYKYQDTLSKITWLNSVYGAAVKLSLEYFF